METTYAGIKEQLHACLKEREQVADILQNEVNQILAAALLRMQCSKTSDNQAGDAFLQSETYLKAAIDKVRALHYSLATQHFVVLC